MCSRRGVLLYGGEAMPVKNGIGYSDYTQVKHDHYRALLEIQVPIVGHILTKHDWAWPSYLHFDITAGNGGTDEQPGSPSIFTSVLKRRGHAYRAVFIEQEQVNADALRARFARDTGVTVEHGDHADILPSYIHACPADINQRTAYGSLFVDPTGCEPPWDLLIEFSRAFRYVDIMIYMSATNLKRIRRARAKRDNCQQPDLHDRLRAIDKKYWLIREYQGAHQWTFLIGTNWVKYPDWKPGGFYAITSPEGQRVLNETNYTAQERAQRHAPQQLALPLYTTYQEYLQHPRYRAVRQQAINRSGGVCERCGVNVVTEVHHIEYPAWGTFEANADNLQAVCHDCHCEIHDKEN
jgi:hypothetical protein